MSHSRGGPHFFRRTRDKCTCKITVAAALKDDASHRFNSLSQERTGTDQSKPASFLTLVV